MSKTATKITCVLAGVGLAAYGAYYLMRARRANVLEGVLQETSGAIIPDALYELVDAEKTERHDEEVLEDVCDASSESTGGSSRVRRRKKRVFTPYGDGLGLQGGYIAYVVAEVQLTHRPMGATETAMASAHHAIVRMMKEHGCRPHDIRQVVQKMVLAVFYQTDEDRRVARAFSEARATGRLDPKAF